MTWANRLRLLLGLIVTLAIVAACTYVFTQRQQSAVSTTATIIAQEYPVGTDYGGLVVKEHVQEGDVVRAGDALFDVQSLQLQRDVAAGIVAGTTGSERVTPEGVSTVVASVDGIVADVGVAQGGYAQAGGLLAVIHRANSLRVEASFVLTPRDYARIAAGSPAEIRLPDQTTMPGTVTHIDVATLDGQALTKVQIVSAALGDGPATGLRQPGTPLSVTVTLRDDGPLAGVVVAVEDLLRRIGL